MQPADRPRDREPEEEGGDAACWLDRVCPDCGAFVERDQRHECPAAD